MATTSDPTPALHGVSSLLEFSNIRLSALDLKTAKGKGRRKNRIVSVYSKYVFLCPRTITLLLFSFPPLFPTIPFFLSFSKGMEKYLNTAREQYEEKGDWETPVSEFVRYVCLHFLFYTDEEEIIFAIIWKRNSAKLERDFLVAGKKERESRTSSVELALIIDQEKKHWKNIIIISVTPRPRWISTLLYTIREEKGEFHSNWTFTLNFINSSTPRG